MKRVVVTGLGALSPLGNNLKETWENATNGISGAQDISRFDTEKFKTTFACEIKGFDPKGVLERNEIKRSDLFTQYALYVSAEAITDSGLDLKKIDPFDIGVIWGSGQGGMDTFEQEVSQFAHGDGTPRYSPFFIPRLISNMASGMISMKFGLMGINYTTVAACATANSSIMDAFNYIKLGKAKVFVTGGSESPVTSASIGGFNALKAMSTRNTEPQKASRPFDVNRDGFVMGEGAGALILEEYEHAKSRGAKIYAEIVGASMTADAYHMTATHPEGKGASKAMEIALAEAGLTAADVDYVNAHATSTPVGDISEIKAITNTFGSSKKLHISSTKSMTGHLLGAAGAIESIFCIKAIQDGIIPPTINLDELDPAVPDYLQIVSNEAKKTNVQVAMNNSFGFGGHNAITLFKKY